MHISRITQIRFRTNVPTKGKRSATKHLPVFPVPQNHLLSLIQLRCRKKVVQKQVKRNDIKTNCAVFFRWTEAGPSALGLCQGRGGAVCTTGAEKLPRSDVLCGTAIFLWMDNNLVFNEWYSLRFTERTRGPRSGRGWVRGGGEVPSRSVYCSNHNKGCGLSHNRLK